MTVPVGPSQSPFQSGLAWVRAMAIPSLATFIPAQGSLPKNSVSEQSFPNAQGSPARRRLISFLLTVLAHLLLLFLLLRLTPPFAKMSNAGGRLTIFSVAPEAKEDAARAKNTPRKVQASRTATPPAAVPPPPIKLPTTAAPWVLTPGLEHFDIRQVPASPQAQQQQPSDASAADGDGLSESDQPVAYGPGGQPLYNAAWYREPTDAELGYYTKLARPGPGYGEIACQTVARYHVDNCVELGESLGSGYARAVREAAWQFLVLPPRVGGKAMVGTWVRIRITFHDRDK